MNGVGTWGLLLLEGSILASVLVIILFVRRSLRLPPPKRGRGQAAGRKNLEVNLEKMSQLLKESEGLSLDLSANLAEKKEIVKKLIDTLEEKIQGLSRLVEKIEGKFPAREAGPIPKDGNGQILEMASAGCAVGEIAKRLGLSKEEVQLILDLRKITAP